MATKKTVFIIGAGASKEANLPLATDLTKKIASALDVRSDDGCFSLTGNDHVLAESLNHVAAEAPFSVGSIRDTAWQIRDAMPQASSIDQFIDNRRGDVKISRCGKLAIARTIILEESQSLLASHGGRLDFRPLEDTWYCGFWRWLIDGCDIAALKGRLSSVALIVFNYDRCVEHYLHNALQNYYEINSSDAASLLHSVEIFHPYGTVGSLPWQDTAHAKIDFGAEVRPPQLLNLAEGIKTFTEGRNLASGELTRCRTQLAEANQVIFLGFAFNPMNLDLLWPTASPRDGSSRKCFATAFGISESDCNEISTDLAHIGNFSPKNVAVRRDLRCKQIFSEFWRRISLL